MKTRRFLLVAAIAVVFGNIHVMAQETQNDNSKKEIKMNELIDQHCHRLESQLALDDKTAAKFTPLYKEYMQSLRTCHPASCQRNQKGQLSDAERIARLEKSFKTRQLLLDTQTKYYKEFKKILNARQLEVLFRLHHKQSAGRHYDKGNYRHYQCDGRNPHKRHGDCHTQRYPNN